MQITTVTQHYITFIIQVQKMAESSKADTTDTPSEQRSAVLAGIQLADENLDSMQGNIIFAPYSLAILRQVMLLATRSDFSLRDLKK